LESGIIYGAGYGRFFKPNFFLAESVETRMTEDYTIFITGREYERDIENVPAMLQGRDILVRKTRIKALLWEQFHEMHSKKYKGVLEYAFGAFDISREDMPSQATDEKIERIIDDILELFVLHEVGEVMEDRGAGGWLELLSAFRSTFDELKLRTVKDILADCSEHGVLKYILSRKSKGLLGFYVVLLTGFHKIVFPEIVNAFQQFQETEDWNDIEIARRKGYSRALSRRDELLSLWCNKGDTGDIKSILDDIK
jgi:hypothetical protein